MRRLALRLRLEDEIGVSTPRAYGVLQGRVLGKCRYERRQDDGLQPAIDGLWTVRRQP